VRVLTHVHELNPSVPVVVRARDEGDIERLVAAGASEVVPEALESGVMLASHTLVWLGIPLSRVMRRVALVREEHYELLRGLFRGESDAPEDEAAPPRLRRGGASRAPRCAGRGRGPAAARLGEKKPARRPAFRGPDSIKACGRPCRRWCRFRRRPLLPPGRCRWPDSARSAAGRVPCRGSIDRRPSVCRPRWPSCRGCWPSR
jgi:hypothetical protein